MTNASRRAYLDHRRAYLDARLAAIQIEVEEIEAELAATSDREEPEELAQGTPAADARFMHSARKELALIIREIEGPNPAQVPRPAALSNKKAQNNCR